jgi:Asp-tRNA(Asn)/Glu-tRNA(Gln) amidotransferase A subunit family amidase
MSEIKRRDFIKSAAAAVAAGAVDPRALGATPPAPGAHPVPQAAEWALANGEPPALQFQAWPGGTGSLLERLWREHGEGMFRRSPIELEPWSGPLPTSAEDLAFLPVSRLGALLRERRISSVELTEIYLERLHRYDPSLLCVVTFLDGRAREEAQQADAEIRAGEWRGPLHGIPYGVKDLFSVRGAPTTWGSADFADRVIDEDAEVVARLRAAGAVLLAKLATGEFAQGDRWFRGQTRNPWNVDEGSSGSSAGPGSATAAACVAFAIGTETRGSIVSPSRRCGLSALRPTFGRVSRYGGMVLSWSMDKTGPMCRSIEDCALVFDAIHGASERDPASLTTPFAFDRDLDLGAVSIGYTQDAPESFLRSLAALGADPRPMPALPELDLNQLDVDDAAAFDFHVAPDGNEPPPPPDGLSDAQRRRAERFTTGRSVRAIDYVNEQRRRHILMQRTAEAMDGFDVLVSGSGELRLTNDTGHPSVVVPYDFGPRNPEAARPTVMPLTAVLVGDLFADDKLLGVAHAFQKTTDWHLRRPDLSRLG